MPATPGKENQVHSELSRLAEAFGHTPPEHDEIQRLLKYSRLFDKVTAQDIMTPPVVCIRAIRRVWKQPTSCFAARPALRGSPIRTARWREW